MTEQTAHKKRKEVLRGHLNNEGRIAIPAAFRIIMGLEKNQEMDIVLVGDERDGYSLVMRKQGE